MTIYILSNLVTERRASMASRTKRRAELDKISMTALKKIKIESYLLIVFIMGVGLIKVADAFYQDLQLHYLVTIVSPLHSILTLKIYFDMRYVTLPAKNVSNQRFSFAKRRNSKILERPPMQKIPQLEAVVEKEPEPEPTENDDVIPVTEKMVASVKNNLPE
jgi:hypothetical protein